MNREGRHPVRRVPVNSSAPGDRLHGVGRDGRASTCGTHPNPRQAVTRDLVKLGSNSRFTLVGLERDSRPCHCWEAAETSEIRAKPAAVRASPRWRVWTLSTSCTCISGYPAGRIPRPFENVVWPLLAQDLGQHRVRTDHTVWCLLGIFDLGFQRAAQHAPRVKGVGQVTGLAQIHILRFPVDRE